MRGFRTQRNMLQRCRNNTAKLVTKKKKKTDHVEPLLRHLHWLPVRSRIECKAAVFSHKCINNTAPEYLSILVSKYTPERSLRLSNKDIFYQRLDPTKKQNIKKTTNQHLVIYPLVLRHQNSGRTCILVITDKTSTKSEVALAFKKRERLYSCKVLLSNAFHFVECALFKDIGSV